MPVRAMDLFEAYTKNEMPKDQGYVVSSFFSGKSAYSIYEVISYSGVKAIYPEGSGLTFQSTGKKLHILIEPASYPHKALEPYVRNNTEQIPKRFNELEILTAKNQTKIMIAKEPVESFSSFTVLRPTGINFALVFYQLPDLYESLARFFEKTLNQEAGIPQLDAKKASKRISAIVEETMSLTTGEYQS
jgi:hypothetical protein